MRLLRRIMSAELIPIRRETRWRSWTGRQTASNGRKGRIIRVLECVFRVLAILGYTVDGVEDTL